MLADNAHMTAVQDAAGRKPLLLACLQGDTDMARMLIGEAKADVSDLRGTHSALYGCFLLHLVCRSAVVSARGVSSAKHCCNACVYTHSTHTVHTQ
jgi:ankyrin repeat protein